MGIITSQYLLFELLGLVIVIVVLIRNYYKKKFSFWEERNVPTIKPSIPTGNIQINRKDAVGVLVKNIYSQQKSLGHKHCGIYFLTRPIYFPIDLEIIRSILTKNFHNFTDRGLFYDEENEPITGHLFFIGGSKWKNLRAKLTPTFTSGKMKMMFPIMVECSQLLVETINNHVDKNEPMDAKDIVSRFTTDVIGSCAFGLDCNSFKDGDSPFRKYGTRFLRPTRGRFLTIIFSASFPKIGKALGLKTLDPDTSDFFTKLANDTVEYRERTNYERNDFIQLLMELKKDGSLAEKQLVAQAFVFFVAGFETSSTAISFYLYELAKNEKIQKKAREDINNVLKQYDGKITYEAVKDMKYLAQVFDETLRKYPPLSVLHRLCTNPCFIEESGLHFEKGQRVMFSILGLHHDPEYFPQPEKFDPERFSDENRSKIKPFTYLPFGEGPRQCIGLRFGIMQSMVGLVTILKNFEFTLNCKTKEPLHMDPRSTALAAEGGVWLNVKKLNFEQ